ncbi:exopolysaccharide biosynthesis polyprenyl glycosylphosphotransferase [Pontiella agarivorans]|uniref:Exopolysaccharide biosynthesis polyprenyl glycosylphosphotransferase n=1 Tax=Pontiella agarivorans TaxID=3038953 RepID=A0ABU5MTQ9_9BACT|nr:exopolysaccharide biosynthesis polyprenyl glycosylphosphotransferase [Pontiella agarivorans]MDZ8117341.1 exopolysaccharide biosynthesis polyprenyl glycosylphosphotransferase [Pontiella agarivorans]
MKSSVVNVDSAGVKPANYYRRAIFNAMSVALSDTLVVAVSVIIAKLLLLWINGLPFALGHSYLIIPVWLLIAMISRLLPGWGIGVVDELRRIQCALFLMFAVILIATFLSQKTFVQSRIVFLFTYLFSAVLIPLGRAAMRGLVIRCSEWGVPVSIYGDRRSVATVINALRAEPGLGYIPSAIFSDEVAQGSVISGVSVRGNLHNITSRAPVAIVTTGMQRSRHQVVKILEGPLGYYRRVILIPDLEDAPSLWVTPRDLQGILGLEITKNLLNPFARFFKRLMDLLLVFGTAPLWGPLMFVLYMLIWLEDRKNPIFLQERVGRTGGTFRTVKFRTMVPNAERVLERALKKDAALKAEWEQHFKLKRDPRITTVGNFLRKTSLDEIPQLLNVLRGTMSLVGPRPLPKYHFDELPEQVRFLRDKVQPGITGLWQVSGRSEAGTAGMEKWDPYYVRNWSIWLDVVIIFRTFKAVFKQEGAY